MWKKELRSHVWVILTYIVTKWKNAEHVDDTVHYCSDISRCKHSKKQLDAGKENRDLRPKKPLNSKKQQNHLYYFMKWHEDLVGSLKHLYDGSFSL